MRLSLSRVVAVFVFSCGTVKARRLSDAVEPLPGPEKEDDEYARGRHCDPQKVHLALGSNAREIRISWSTSAPGCSSKVHFGRSGYEAGPLRDDLEVPALSFSADITNSESFGPDDFCSEPATRDDFEPPNLYSAVLTQLEPGEWYAYQIGHHKPVRHFKAPPEVGPDVSFTFIAYGDMGDAVHKSAKSPGAKYTADRVTDEVVKGGAELVLHVGDIAYADGNHEVWESFMEQIEPYASRAPYLIAIGNHEYDYETAHKEKHKKATEPDPSGRKDPYRPDWGNYGNDSGGECGVAVSKLFLMPGAELPRASSNHKQEANPPFWFSYNYGSAHFTTISTEHDLSSGSSQRRWMQRDLAGVNRCRTPWVVLLSHRPMYVVHPHKSNRIVGEHLREFIEPLLEEHRVDLVLSGHVHAYARTCSVLGERCTNNQRGTLHVTLGCGGRKLSSVTHTQPEWLEFTEREFGYGRITVEGRERLVFNYVHSKSGKVKDSVTLRPKAGALRADGCEFQGVRSSHQESSAAEAALLAVSRRASDSIVEGSRRANAAISRAFVWGLRFFCHPFWS